VPTKAQASESAAVNRGGRPPKITADAKTLETLKGLGGIQATTREAAAVLGISEQALFDWFKREPVAREVWDAAKDEGKASLRRIQMQLATKNAAMAIFLGKNLLGQSDKHEMEHSGPQGGAIQTDGTLRIEFVRPPEKPDDDDGSAT
jgi:hypothetical protein